MTTKAGDPSDHQAARALVALALRLTESERVQVAAELLESLEGPEDDASDDEWLAEINRRADSVRRGESAGEPWTVVRDELLAELRK
jgi:putative addiction module component (TIGR02574 family)